MFKKQFLLTKEETFKEPWDKVEIGDYNLFFHPDLEFTFSKKNQNKLYLIGSLFDCQFPALSNKQIVEKLNDSNSLEELFQNISVYTGDYVLIFDRNDDIIIFNDACAQYEIYYDHKFSVFGTQPKLLAEVIELIPHDDPEAIEFYSSEIFKSKCLFVGETTNFKNIKHLLPNHFINISKKIVSRFFPSKAISEDSLDEIAKKASVMIKGYLNAISLRKKMAIAVTGGYDSRVLFLASLETKSSYYVSKYDYMGDDHYDISIPRKLTSLYDRKLHIINESIKAKDEFSSEYIKSIDFPRFLNVSDKVFQDHVFINGNISEIARNYFGYFTDPSPKELSLIFGYSAYKFAVIQFDKYLNMNKSLFENLGYNLLDMLYWEEKMGIWAAKAKTEAAALGANVISPFNSRSLLTSLLSVKRKYRDSHDSKLYNKIIYYLSDNNKDVQRLPINPCWKTKIILILKNFKIYNLLKNLELKTKKIFP